MRRGAAIARLGLGLGLGHCKVRRLAARPSDQVLFSGYSVFVVVFVVFVCVGFCLLLSFVVLLCRPGRALYLIIQS